jgi:MoaA/NifB/PqqE/SkfB family radical SAM enzyme
MPQKLLKFTPKYYESRGGGLSEATYLGLNISDRCNYRCKKCVQGSPYRSGTELSIDDFMGLVARAKDELGTKALFIAGRGETLLAGRGESEEEYLQNYRKLVGFAGKKDIDVLQFTNGYHLDKSMVDFLGDRNVSLVVSIDSLDGNKYLDLCRGPKDSFVKVMKNLEYARKRFPMEGGENEKIYRLAINMAVSHDNFEEVDKIKEFCNDDLMFICNYPIIRGNFKRYLEEMCKSKAEYEAFKHKVLEASDNNGFSGTTYDGRCGFIYHGLSIDSNGNVLLCPYDPSTGNLFGNIKDYKNMEEALMRVKTSVLKHSEQNPTSRICFLRDAENYGRYPAIIPEK